MASGVSSSPRGRSPPPRWWSWLAALLLTTPALAEGLPASSASVGGPGDAGPTPVASGSSGLDPLAAARGASALLHSAEATQHELARLEARAALPEELQALERELPRLTEEAYGAAGQALAQIRGATRWFAIADAEYALHRRHSRLAAGLGRVADHVEQADAARQRIDAILEEARHASEDATLLQLDGAARAKLRRSIARAQLARLNVQRSASAALRLRAGLEDATRELEQVLDLAKTGGPSLTRDLLRTGPNVLETLGELPRGRELWEIPGAALRHNGATFRDFLGNSRALLLTHLLLGAGILLSLRWVRQRARAWPAWPGLGEPEHPLERPLTATLLLTVAATLLIDVALPASAVVLAFSLVALCGLRLLPGLRLGISLGQRQALYLLLVLDLGRLFLVELPSLERLLMLAEGTLGAALLLAVLRRVPRGSAKPQDLWGKLRWIALRAWLLAYLLGTLVLALGLVHTGTTLISGATTSLLGAVVWTAVHRILAEAARVTIQATPSREPRPDHLRRRFVTRRLGLGLAALFALVWARTTLGALTLWEPAVRSGGELLALSVEIGSLHVSLGSLVALGLGVLLAVYGARAVRSVLDEDLLPHTRLTAGTRAATSTSAYYGLLLVGLFLTIGAAGVELDKLTLIAGALSVGIGFGLQNLVQNFVAGLILIFGRPINVEDRIQLGELSGIVRQIGFRASTVRTFQGAEVIVPNSDLISTQVINWTLSDPNRRLEIDIGVAYGTDPERVVTLLVEIARAHPEILDSPAPDALFLSHGSSSLDFQLRAWTRNVTDWPNIRSELTMAINRALQQEGIEIPFPQRDLHLRSLPPELARTLQPR